MQKTYIYTKISKSKNLFFTNIFHSPFDSYKVLKIEAHNRQKISLYKPANLINRKYKRRPFLYTFAMLFA
jgi:hypothetical protein